MPARMQKDRYSHSLQMGMQNDTVFMEDILAVSYKSNYTLTIRFSNYTLRYLQKKLVENLYPPKKLYMNNYSSFIHNCLNLESYKISFSKWMYKLWHIQMMEYGLALHKRWSIQPWKEWRELKYRLVNERSQSKKAVYSMVLDIQYYGKGKTLKIVIEQWLPGITG